jgi:hypothetical protein
MGGGRKQFFFEKKHQKTFVFLVVVLAGGLARAAAPQKHAQHGMSVTTWFSLAEDPGRPSAIRAKPGLYAPPADNDGENIFVFSRRSHAQDEAWWPDSKSGLPLYESSNSDAAQPLVPYAAWTSPEQQRLTSAIKDAAGACGLFMLTCPTPK